MMNIQHTVSDEQLICGAKIYNAKETATLMHDTTFSDHTSQFVVVWHKNKWSKTSAL